MSQKCPMIFFSVVLPGGDSSAFQNAPRSSQSVSFGAPDAASFMIELIRGKGLVFLSDRAFSVQPLFFLDENIEALHSDGSLNDLIAGVETTDRLLDEGGLPPDRQTVNRYIRSIYYLKLFYNELFEYDFWNPVLPLSVALEYLRDRIRAAGGQPSSLLRIEPPSRERLREYYGLLLQGVHGETLFPADLFRKARDLFPEDLWSSYWLAAEEMRERHFAEALNVWDQILTSPLSRCMENLPDSYRQAALCAERLARTELAEEYEGLARHQINEHELATGDAMN